jgi:hypothetical protein
MDTVSTFEAQFASGAAYGHLHLAAFRVFTDAVVHVDVAELLCRLQGADNRAIIRASVVYSGARCSQSELIMSSFCGKLA